MGRKPKDDGENLPVLEGGEGAAARDALQYVCDAIPESDESP